MIVVLKHNVPEEKRNQLINWLRSQRIDVHPSLGEYQTVLGLVGDTSRIDMSLLESLDIVVVHTHSSWATSWAQAGRAIPCYGTTHADYIYGEVPCVRNLDKSEIAEAYEKNTGILIADYFKKRDYEAVPAVLCKNHGPFTWGKDAHEAVHNAVVLEEVAKMASRCELINPNVKPAPQELQDKHYYRKHGANAYYGQENIE